jgi:tRNA(Ile)-lysidine synthase
MGLLDHVDEFFQRQHLVNRPGVLAISGGPDSVALAHACVALWQQQRMAQVTLAHLNHQLRGTDSDADEAFVKKLPVAWNAPQLRCHTRRIDVALAAQQRGDNLENAGRDERYRWLTEIAQREDAAWVATGHTADDQAETVLHHLLRGSGLAGLAGMTDRRSLTPVIDLVRPLLAIRRAQVMAYLQENQLIYCRDASNDDLSFTRNLIRHKLMPVLERDYNPQIVEVLGRTALQLREIQDELAKQARALLKNVELPRAGAVIVLKRAPLEAAGPVLVRESLRIVWQREGWPQGEMGFADWERAAALVSGASAGNDFPGGVRVRATDHVIQIERRDSRA